MGNSTRESTFRRPWYRGLERMPGWHRLLHWLDPGRREAWQGVETPALEPSDALMERLMALPTEMVLCRDVDRRWSELVELETLHSPATRPSPERHALERHVEGCPRCSELVESLRAAANLPQLELPAPLVFRLPQIARQRPRLPRSVREPRWALAASLLMALAVQLLVGDLQALAQGSYTSASRPPLETVRGAVLETRSRAQVFWGSWKGAVVEEIEPVLSQSRSGLDAYSQRLRHKAHEFSTSVEALKCRAQAEGWSDARNWPRLPLRSSTPDSAENDDDPGISQ